MFATSQDTKQEAAPQTEQSIIDSIIEVGAKIESIKKLGLQQDEASATLADIKSQIEQATVILKTVLAKKSDEERMEKDAANKLFDTKSLVSDEESKLATLRFSAERVNGEIARLDAEMMQKQADNLMLDSENSSLRKMGDGLQDTLTVQGNKVARMNLDLLAISSALQEKDRLNIEMASNLTILEKKRDNIIEDIARVSAKMVEVTNDSAVASKSFQDINRSIMVSKNDLVILQEKLANEEKSFNDSCDIREADLNTRTVAADKRENWNEEIRQKLIAYKLELENYYKRTFKDLII